MIDFFRENEKAKIIKGFFPSIIQWIHIIFKISLESFSLVVVVVFVYNHESCETHTHTHTFDGYFVTNHLENMNGKKISKEKPNTTQMHDKKNLFNNNIGGL